MKRQPLLLIGAAVVAQLACSSDSTGPAGDGCTAETGSVDATVTVGASVVFDWSPRCGVALLLVEENASDMWSVSTPESDWDSPVTANRIMPPVTYGQAPAGTETEGPEPLVAGVTYELVLWRILPSGSTVQCRQRLGDACLLAVEEFTR